MQKVPLIKSTVVSSRPLIPGFSPKCLKLSHKRLKIKICNGNNERSSVVPAKLIQYWQEAACKLMNLCMCKCYFSQTTNASKVQGTQSRTNSGAIPWQRSVSDKPAKGGWRKYGLNEDGWNPSPQLDPLGEYQGTPQIKVPALKGSHPRWTKRWILARLRFLPS